MPRMLVAWCPDWPVVAAGAPPADPVAVVHANRVVACSPAARDEGVRPGLRRREAQTRCPGLELLAHDPARDARAFEPVLVAVEALTPWVEVLRPGECAFPARGAARHHGGEPALAAAVTAAVHAALGGPPPSCRVGIADGTFAAGLAARHRAVVPPGGSQRFLAPFSVATLERPDLADLLVRLGLRTLGDLAALPAADLATRFGPEGSRAHRLASGLDEWPRAARRPPPDLRAVAELDPPAERVDVAAFAAKALADGLVARLERLGLACTRLRVEAETEHGETLTRIWRHDAGAGRAAAAMAERVRWQLDGWLTGPAHYREVRPDRLQGSRGLGNAQAPLAGGAAGRPTGALTRLVLAPDEVVPDRGRQLGFWGEQTEAGERAARALHRIQGLLGAEAVRTARLRGGRDPADRVASYPGDHASPGGPPGPAPWPGRVPDPAPAIVHPEPLPAEVVDAAGLGVTVDGRGLLSATPSRLRVGGGGWSAIAAWAGPWPVDERWWDPGAHRRLARLQVTTGKGAAHLLKLYGGRWWVEATYD